MLLLVLELRGMKKMDEFKCSGISASTKMHVCMCCMYVCLMQHVEVSSSLNRYHHECFQTRRKRIRTPNLFMDGKHCHEQMLHHRKAKQNKIK